MDHKLRVLVHLTLERQTASVEVTGCLTEGSCAALFLLLRRLRKFPGGLAVTIDLRRARHIEFSALERLETMTGWHPARGYADASNPGELRIQPPEPLPVCPALRLQCLEDARRARQNANPGRVPVGTR